MVRATLARVLIRVGGTRPTWLSADSQITDFCTQADYVIDGYTYPKTISTTSDAAIELAVDVVLRMMLQAKYIMSSGAATSADGRSYGDTTILTSSIKETIASLLETGDYTSGLILVKAISGD